MTDIYFKEKRKLLKPNLKVIGFISDFLKIQYLIHLSLADAE
jgi:hypothetical protein